MGGVCSAQDNDQLIMSMDSEQQTTDEQILLLGKRLDALKAESSRLYEILISKMEVTPGEPSAEYRRNPEDVLQEWREYAKCESSSPDMWDGVTDMTEYTSTSELERSRSPETVDSWDRMSNHLYQMTPAQIERTTRLCDVILSTMNLTPRCTSEPDLEYPKTPEDVLQEWHELLRAESSPEIWDETTDVTEVTHYTSRSERERSRTGETVDSWDRMSNTNHFVSPAQVADTYSNHDSSINEFWEEVSELHVQKQKMCSKMKEMSQKLQQYEKRHKEYKEILKEARQEVEFLNDSLTEERRKYKVLNEDLQLALKVKQSANEDELDFDVNIGGAETPRENPPFPFKPGDNESIEEVALSYGGSEVIVI